MRKILETIYSFLSGFEFRSLFLFIFAFLMSFFLTPIIRFAALKLKILDMPSDRKIHKVPMPLLGGLAIYISYVITIILNFSFSIELKGVIIGGTIILFVGIIDDIWGLSAKIRLMGQIVAASILILFRIKLDFLPNVWWGNWGEILLTVIWVIGITNAANFFDGMDGLLTGLTAICSLSFFVVAQITDQPYLGFLTIALAGACLGFLKFNFKPASIFLGDSGSTFLGFTLAEIAVMGGWAEKNPKIALSLPILVLSVFIFDMVYITVARTKEGKVKNFKEWIDYTGKDHFHHRLVAFGFNEVQTVLMIYLIAACLGTGAINLRATGDLRIYFSLLQAFFIFVLITILMLAGRKLNKK